MTFDALTTGCARFVGRPSMLVVCAVQGALGLFAWWLGDEAMMAGTNLLISVTTLMLLPFLQATQNRDGAALQAKIDELIRSHAEARDTLIGLEKHTTAEIEEMRGG